MDAATLAATTRDIQTAGGACRLWLDGVPPVRGLRTAAIGGFACESAAAGQALLGQALDELRREGFWYAIGPMDGTTWRNYRLVLESDGSAPFFMEPRNPPHYPDAFRAAGFAVIADYASARATDHRTRAVSGYARRLRQAGITIRPFDREQADADLAAMYRLAREAFAKNFLYTPIPQYAFMAMYRPVVDMVEPDFVLMAEDGGGDLQAFLFAVPDFAQDARPDQLVIKTYASRYPGLGGYLAETIHERAAAAGYRAVTHALMHCDNPSSRNSAKYGQVFRRYGLFGQEIGP